MSEVNKVISCDF